MAMAATISPPLTSPARRLSLTSFTSLSNSHSFTNQLSFLRPTRPCIGVSAGASSPISMRLEAAEKASTASFLDRRETGFLHFVKYQGLGNDFILVDNRDSSEPRVTPEQAVKLCDRNFGIGGDGVIFAMPGINGTDYTMRIFNSDGSEPEMCELQDDGQVKVDMGEPVLKASDVPTRLPANKDQSVVKSDIDVNGETWSVTCVSMGNPHCVTFGKKGGQALQVDELNLADIGPKFEHHEMFPARTNTEFVQVFSPSHVKMRVWERGAGATLACGTGACAVVVAAVLEGRAGRNCTVELPGGPLQIEWREEDNHIYMTGPAEVAFYGSVQL
ncbi:hypothetical protein F8388_025176 [Cannabis sativa]|uniref:Diaminopimelate epimerase n=1 Tax=Cannabis sativa TaxID=3483 RepID=A0A7J6FS69_CANSA|nr:hypothetical protein F8388_025176 [Cannabis sativa]